MEEIKNLLEIDDNYLNDLGIIDKVQEIERQFDPNTYEPEFNFSDSEVEDIVEEDNKSSKKKKRKKNINPLPDNHDPRQVKIDRGIEGEDYITTHRDLPKVPFSILVNGARGSGKTYQTTELLGSLHPYFHKVILYSPTAELDNKWRRCFKSLGIEWKVGDNIFYNYDEVVLKKQMDALYKINKGKAKITDKYRTFFIFDDIIDDLPKNKRKTFFNKLLLNNRHYGASVAILSQSYKMLDSNFRKNVSQLLIWKSDNVKEIDNYCEELSGTLGRTKKQAKENFLDLYEYATKPKHGFLYINYHRPPEDRYSSGWNDVLELC